MKQNREINEELEKYMSEDEKIIELIIKKWSKLAPERIQRYKWWYYFYLWKDFQVRNFNIFCSTWRKNM